MSKGRRTRYTARNPKGLVDQIRRCRGGFKGLAFRQQIPLTTLYAVPTRQEPPYELLHKIRAELRLSLEEVIEAWWIARDEHLTRRKGSK